MVGRGCMEPKGRCRGISKAKREEQSEEGDLEGEVDALHPSETPRSPADYCALIPVVVMEGWEGVLGLNVVRLRGISWW